MIDLPADGKLVIWGSIEENNPRARSILGDAGRSWISKPAAIDNTRVMNGERAYLFASTRAADLYTMSAALTAIVTDQANCSLPTRCAQNIWIWGSYYSSSVPVPRQIFAPGGCGNQSSTERIVEIFTPSLYTHPLGSAGLVVRTNLNKIYVENNGWTELEYLVNVSKFVPLNVGSFLVYTTQRQLFKYDAGTPTLLLEDVDVADLESDGRVKFWVLLTNGTLYYYSSQVYISDYFNFAADFSVINTTAFIPAGRTIVSITGATSYIAFLLDNGSVVACYGHYADSFDKNTNGYCELVPLPTGVIVEKILPGGSHFLMRSTTGRIFFSGTNSMGEHGNGETNYNVLNQALNATVNEFSAVGTDLEGRAIDDFFLMPYGSYAVSTVRVMPSDAPIGFTATQVQFNVSNIPREATSLAAEIVIEGSQILRCANAFELSRPPASTGNFSCVIRAEELETLFLSRSNSTAFVAPLFLRISAFRDDFILERSAWTSVGIVHFTAILASCNDTVTCPHANTAGNVLKLRGSGFGTDTTTLHAFVVDLRSPIPCRPTAVVDTLLTCELDRLPAEGFLQVGVFRFSPPTISQVLRYPTTVRFVSPGMYFSYSRCSSISDLGILNSLLVPAIVSSLAEIPATSPVLVIRGSSWGTDPADLDVEFVQTPRRSCHVFKASETELSCYTNASANPFRVNSDLLAVVTRASGRSAMQYVARIVAPPTVATSNSSSGKFSMSTKLVKVEGERLGTSVAELNVTLVLQSSRRRRSSSAEVLIPCLPRNVTETYILCVPGGDFPTTGPLSAIIYRQGAPSGAAVVIGQVVAPPRISSTSSTRTLAANADRITISGSGFAPHPFHKENSVVLSAGSCTDIITATTQSIECQWTGSSTAVTTLSARVFSYGGESSDGEIPIAKIVSPPSFTSTSSDTSFPIGSTALSFRGSSFDPSQSGTTKVLITYDISTPNPISTPCTVESVTSERLTCSVPAGSLNKTGNIYAQVLAYGGSSNFTSVAFIFDPAGQIAGGVIGGVVSAFAIAGIVVLLFYRRRVAAFERQKKMLESQIPKELQPLVNIKSSEIKMMHKLGEGSFGAVFLAEYKGRYCAVKKLSANVIASAVSEFFREASLMLSIKPHRNIVRVFGMCQEMGSFLGRLMWLGGWKAVHAGAFFCSTQRRCLVSPSLTVHLNFR